MFKSGEKVLVFLPIPDSTLRAKYFGLFELDREVNDSNFRIKTPGQHKSKPLRHMNMIKQYHDITYIVRTKVESVIAENPEVATLDQDKCSFT